MSGVTPSCPRICRFRCADIDEQELFPEEPLTGTVDTESHCAGRICAAALDVKVLVTLILIRIGMALDLYRERLGGGVIICRDRTLEI